MFFDNLIKTNKCISGEVDNLEPEDGLDGPDNTTDIDCELCLELERDSIYFNSRGN